MKWVAGILFLINVGVGAYFFWAQSVSSSQAVAYSPVNAEKIVLKGSRLANDQAPANEPVPTTRTSSEPICVEWRGFAAGDLERGRDAIKKLAAQRVLSVEELPINRMYWVVFPPLPSEAASKVKLQEMLALKIKEAFIIQDDIWKNGLSLGLFSTEDAARRHIRELEDKGVSGLRLETKPKEGTAYYYLVKSEDAATLRDLDDVRQSFPATTLTRVACKK